MQLSVVFKVEILSAMVKTDFTMLVATVCLENGTNGPLVLPQENSSLTIKVYLLHLCAFTWKCPEVGGAGRELEEHQDLPHTESSSWAQEMVALVTVAFSEVGASVMLSNSAWPGQRGEESKLHHSRALKGLGRKVNGPCIILLSARD